MSKGKRTILVVDAEPETRRMLEIVLEPNEFAVEECLTGKEAARRCISLKPDLILLDLNLPDISGTDVIGALRAWSKAPIIVVTARTASQDAVDAFNLGADDYVLKPFDMSVLEARIHSSLRKTESLKKGDPELVNGPLRMDLAQHQVYLGEELLKLTPKEYDLLRHFLVHCGKMLTHKELLTAIWGDSRSEDSRYLRVFICKIREKIEAAGRFPPLIVTQPGIGYRMEILDAAVTAQA